MKGDARMNCDEYVVMYSASTKLRRLAKKMDSTVSRVKYRLIYKNLYNPR